MDKTPDLSVIQNSPVSEVLMENSSDTNIGFSALYLKTVTHPQTSDLQHQLNFELVMGHERLVKGSIQQFCNNPHHSEFYDYSWLMQNI